MTVYRADVSKAHILEQRRVQQAVLHPVLQAMGQLIYGLSSRNLMRHSTVDPFDAEIARPGAQCGQMVRHTAHIVGNRHLVIV